MYRVSQNKYVISGDWCKILPYLCNSPAWYFKNLLLHPMAKKSAKLFFLSKSKIWKSKIVYPYHFYQILKFYKYYLNCEHDLFVYISKQRRKNSADLKKKFVDFQNFKKFNEDRILMETNI